MRYEVEFRRRPTVVEQFGDLLGDPLIRDGAGIYRIIGVDHALPNFRNEVRLALPQSAARRASSEKSQ